MLATALKGMVVVAAHKRMFYPQDIVDGFMEINLNKKCYKALNVWNSNLVDATLNFKKYGEMNMLEFVHKNEGMTRDLMSIAMFQAFDKNYGDQYRVSVSVWDATSDDFGQGFYMNNDWSWLGLHEAGYSYFIAVRPNDAKEVPILFDLWKNSGSALSLESPKLIAQDIMKK